mgnify:CR=1 FL=1
MEAVADLDRMAAEGALRFGYAKSEAYEREIVAMLDALAMHPNMAPERQATHSLVRLMSCGSHNILYIVDDQDVVVLRVLHGLQNWFDLL